MKLSEHPKREQVVSMFLQRWQNPILPTWRSDKYFVYSFEFPDETVYVRWDLRGDTTALDDDDVITFTEFAALQLGG